LAPWPSRQTQGLPYVTGDLHNWLTSFLSDRIQTVAVCGQESEALPVCAGVPQSSVLGSSLSLVFLRDMADGVARKLSFNADDSTFQSPPNLPVSRPYPQQGSIQHWAETWCARFNASKTQVLTISRARDGSDDHPTLFLDNQALVEAEEIKIVGLHLNRRQLFPT
jgi:hypothetical protein